MPKRNKDESVAAPGLKEGLDSNNKKESKVNSHDTTKVSIKEREIMEEDEFQQISEDDFEAKVEVAAEEISNHLEKSIEGSSGKKEAIETSGLMKSFIEAKNVYYNMEELSEEELLERGNRVISDFTRYLNVSKAPASAEIVEPKKTPKKATEKIKSKPKSNEEAQKSIDEAAEQTLKFVENLIDSLSPSIKRKSEKMKSEGKSAKSLEVYKLGFTLFFKTLSYVAQHPKEFIKGVKAISKLQAEMFKQNFTDIKDFDKGMLASSFSMGGVLNAIIKNDRAKDVIKKIANILPDISSFYRVYTGKAKLEKLQEAGNNRKDAETIARISEDLHGQNPYLNILFKEDEVASLAEVLQKDDSLDHLFEVLTPIFEGQSDEVAYKEGIENLEKNDSQDKVQSEGLVNDLLEDADKQIDFLENDPIIQEHYHRMKDSHGISGLIGNYFAACGLDFLEVESKISEVIKSPADLAKLMKGYVDLAKGEKYDGVLTILEALNPGNGQGGIKSLLQGVKFDNEVIRRIKDVSTAYGKLNDASITLNKLQFLQNVGYEGEGAADSQEINRRISDMAEKMQKSVHSLSTVLPLAEISKSFGESVREFLKSEMAKPYTDLTMSGGKGLKLRSENDINKVVKGVKNIAVRNLDAFIGLGRREEIKNNIDSISDYSPEALEKLVDVFQKELMPQIKSKPENNKDLSSAFSAATNLSLEDGGIIEKSLGKKVQIGLQNLNKSGALEEIEEIVGYLLSNFSKINEAKRTFEEKGEVDHTAVIDFLKYLKEHGEVFVRYNDRENNENAINLIYEGLIEKAFEGGYFDAEEKAILESLSPKRIANNANTVLSIITNDGVVNAAVGAKNFYQAGLEGVNKIKERLVYAKDLGMNILTNPFSFWKDKEADSTQVKEQNKEASLDESKIAKSNIKEEKVAKNEVEQAKTAQKEGQAAQKGISFKLGKLLLWQVAGKSKAELASYEKYKAELIKNSSKGSGDVQLDEIAEKKEEQSRDRGERDISEFSIIDDRSTLSTTDSEKSEQNIDNKFFDIVDVEEFKGRDDVSLSEFSILNDSQRSSYVEAYDKKLNNSAISDFEVLKYSSDTNILQSHINSQDISKKLYLSREMSEKVEKDVIIIEEKELDKAAKR